MKRAFHTSLIAAAVLIVSTMAVGSEPNGPSGTLRWANGDTLPGTLLDLEGRVLRWKSPLFTDALGVRLPSLRSISFEVDGESDRCEEPFRLEMRNGNVLYADLIKIDKKDIVFRAKRHGEFRVLRDGIRAVRRMNNPSLVYLGPTGTANWKTLGETRHVSEWSPSIEGRLSTVKRNAEIFRELDVAGNAEIELMLETTGKLEFVLGMDDHPADSLRIETWDDEVVAVSGHEFEPLVSLPKSKAKLQLRLYWDQAAGKVTAYSQSGKRLGSLAEASPKADHRPGFYLRNKGKALTLASLRVSRWNGETPRTAQKGRSRLHLVDGSILYGQIGRFHAGRIALGEGTDSRDVPMDQIDTIYMADDAENVAERNVDELAYADGSFLSGVIEKIENGTAIVKTPFTDAPFVANLGGIRQLSFQKTIHEGQAAYDELHCDGGLLHGTLVGGNGSGSAIQWKPVGGANASSLAPECEARFVRKIGSPRPAYDRSTYGDILFLNNRDIVPCQVESIDGDHINILTPFTDTLEIPRDDVKAVELATGNVHRSGFDDDGWQSLGDDETVKIDADRVTIGKPGAFGHASILRGNEVKFDLQWQSGKKSQYAHLTICLYGETLERPVGSVNLDLYLSNNRLYLRGSQRNVVAGVVVGQVSRSVAVTGNKASIRLLVDKDTLTTFVNDQVTWSSKGSIRQCGGHSILFRVNQSHGRDPAKLTFSNFSVSRSTGVFAWTSGNEETREVSLTIPRFRKQDPPTHVLVASNGDLLRGRLASLDGDNLSFVSRLETFTFPRQRIDAIVSINGQSAKPTDDTVDPSKTNGPIVRAILDDGTRIVMTPKEMDTERLVGQSASLGECSVALGSLRELHVGDFGQLEDASDYAQWEPRPAPEPRFADGESGGGAPEASPIGSVAEDFQGDLLKEGKWQLSRNADKIIVLDFWATWCNPCVRAMPEYLKALDGFNSKDVAFVAVNQGEPAETVNGFLQRHDWDMTVLLDSDGAIGAQFGVTGIPHTVVLAPGGVVKWTHTGFRPGDADDLKQIVEKLLAERPED